MQTPMPVQLEEWIRVVKNKRSPYDLRQNATLHLTKIRDIIDESLRHNSDRSSKKNENLFTR
jgi:hypothetical protein